MGTDVRNIRVFSFDKNTNEKLGDKGNRLLSSRVLEEDEESEFYSIDMAVDKDESVSAEEFRNKVGTMKKDIDSGAMVIEGAEMVTKEIPVVMVAVPVTNLEVVNETEDGKKTYKFKANKEETIGDVQGTTAQETVEVQGKKQTAAVIVSIVTVVLVLAGVTAFYLIRKNKNLKRSSISAIPHLDTQSDQNVSS